MPGAKNEARSYFRHIFAEPAGAFLIFSLLLLALVGIAGRTAMRAAGVAVLINRLGVTQEDARKIARAVSDVGGDGRSIDFSRVQHRKEVLRNVIHERMAYRDFMHHVEVRDRFGVRQLFISRDSVALEPPRAPVHRLLPLDWPELSEQIVRVPLLRGEGEVLVGVSQDALLPELQQLHRSLWTKITVATSAAVAILVLGFIYVLYLIRRNRRLEQSRQSAARASYVGLLASGLAHEIRNPLNAMNMNLQMLEEEIQALPDPEESDYAELLESTKGEIKRLDGLVNNFLQYARPTLPRFEVRDLNEVVAEVLRFLELDFKKNSIELRQSLEPLLPTVELDETQFKQALINLLVNARQVVQPGGVVEVLTRPGSHGEVVLEVRDDGPGIPHETRDRIFEVFYSSRGGGTGLGLPIAKQVIQQHGGTIELESVVGEGTTFRIRFPRHQRRPVGEPPHGE